MKQLLSFSKQWIKKEFRVLIKHCFLIDKNIVEAKQWFDRRYRDSEPALAEPRIITAKNGKKDIKSIAIMILWRNSN